VPALPHHLDAAVTYDPLAFHQPVRLFAVRRKDEAWLRSGKGGRPVLKWGWGGPGAPPADVYVTDDPATAHDVAGWCRLREPTAYVTEVVADDPYLRN
jgi:hypothetical protein